MISPKFATSRKPAFYSLPQSTLARDTFLTLTGEAPLKRSWGHRNFHRSFPFLTLTGEAPLKRLLNVTFPSVNRFVPSSPSRVRPH